MAARTLTPEVVARQVESLWPCWVSHLAALAAGQPTGSDFASSTSGGLLNKMLCALCTRFDRGETAAAAADGLWERVLGREEGGLLASMASVSALLAAFQAQPNRCLERAAAKHLEALGWIVLLPGSGTRQRLGSGGPTRQALEQLCFKACPKALLGALGAAEEQDSSRSPPFLLRAEFGLPHHALLLGNALSCWRHCHPGQPKVASLLEELEWVRGWVRALDALAQAAALTGCTADMQDMHEALVLMCSRALAGAGRDKPRQAQVMLSVQQDARLLPWYAEELLRNVRGEILSAAQGVRESCRGHWKTLNQLNFYWSQLRNGIADTIAAQPQLQEWWLEALTAFGAQMEAANRSGACPYTWAPLSKLHCWRAFVSADAYQEVLTPAYMCFAMAGFSSLHLDLHTRLLASDAAAAQRTEAAAAAAARSCLRVARAVEGRQVTLAASRQQDAEELDGTRDPFEDSVDALTVFIDALGKSPAFSCQASCRPGAPRVPGRRAVAAVIDALQLIAEVLQAVAGMPALRRVHLDGFSSTLPAALCMEVAGMVDSYLLQTLPGRQVQLTSCIAGEQVGPMLQALLGLLCAQRKAVTWLLGPGRADMASCAETAECLPLIMEHSTVRAALTSVDLLKRTLPSPSSQNEGEEGLAARWRAGLAHIALSAALAAHALPGTACQRKLVRRKPMQPPLEFQLAWQLADILGNGDSGQCSVRACAAQLVCASVRSLMACTDNTPGSAAQELLSLLECINVEAAPLAAVLALLASGALSLLTGWAMQRAANLLEPSVAQVMRRLEQLLGMVCRAADSLLLPLGGEARFAAANERPSKQVQDALRALSQERPQSRKRLEAQGIAGAVRDAWEWRCGQLLPAMERAARCGSAFAVTWQQAGAATSGSYAATAAAAAPRHSCPLPAVQQALALAGVACANPLCTRLGNSGVVGEAAAGDQLQRCRGCRVAGYCCAACGREDWERHRPACNALGHLRHGTASVRPAVGPRRA